MVYEPAEDSFLIQKEVKLLAKGSVLDIGTGSGILAKTSAESKKVKSVLGVDIQKKSVDYCKDNVKNRKVRFIVSDLFSKVPRQKFDTIIFNPPYLPAEKDEDAETAFEVSGGKHGYEIVERFFASVNDYLAPDGIVLLLFSTLTGKSKVEAIISQHMMDFDELNKLKISFEQLYVYRIRKTKFRVLLEKSGISNILPLGKGHRGLIYTGKWKGKKVTIKIQRQDIGVTGTVNNEIKQLQLLNKHDIGPELLFYGNDYFVYEYVAGDFIKDHFDKPGTKKEDVIAVLKDVFRQMFTLDKLGRNKEEMHNPFKHVIVTKERKPVLIDFERCKHHARVHNVTQFVQFVISGRLLSQLENHKIKIDMLEMMNRAKKYSQHKTRENFDKVLELIR